MRNERTRLQLLMLRRLIRIEIIHRQKAIKQPQTLLSIAYWKHKPTLPLPSLKLLLLAEVKVQQIRHSTVELLEQPAFQQLQGWVCLCWPALCFDSLARAGLFLDGFVYCEILKDFLAHVFELLFVLGFLFLFVRLVEFFEFGFFVHWLFGFHDVGVEGECFHELVFVGVGAVEWGEEV